jgi:hydroxyacylglutathione hydrolase
MRVIPIPCLKDNYAYLLIGDGGGGAVVVDPSEPGPVEAALARERVTLSAIWLTHHHYDHVGGVTALCEKRPGLPVLGSRYDLEHGRIPNQTVGLSEGDALSFAGQPVQLLEIPGHTLGAIAFILAGCLFSGDTLFTAGCGRVFEGTMAMMQQSLAKLRALPAATRLYCGHEYTVSNLRFAQAVEPGAQPVQARLGWANGVRDRGEPTVGTALGEELATNPFLRWDAAAVIARAREWGSAGQDPASVFGALRTAKDKF